jgi:hypothetical protein
LKIEKQDEIANRALGYGTLGIEAPKLFMLLDCALECLTEYGTSPGIAVNVWALMSLVDADTQDFSLRAFS